MTSPRPDRSGGEALGLLVLLDLNETLVRTGEVSPPDREEELRHLTRFVEICRELTNRYGTLSLVFMTGNSFEYSRRIEEPLGLKNLPGVELTIVSENGLIGRSFRRGNLWRFDTTASYAQSVSRFLKAAADEPALRGEFYSQGNEVRTTLKPVGNSFPDRTLASLTGLADSLLDAGSARVYAHRFYFDIDPAVVRTEEGVVEFGGKKDATLRIASDHPISRIVAIGDSASDIPMFEAVLSLGGSAFWVANAGHAEEIEGVERSAQPFAAGVNEVLESTYFKLS